MRQQSRFVPEVVALEQIALMATFAAEVAGFFGPIVNKGTNSDEAYGFPGMQFGVKAQLPYYGYVGIKKVTYDFGPSVFNTVDANVTVYNKTKGDYGLRTSHVISPPGTSTQSVEQHFYANKELAPNALTITVSVEAYKYGGGTDTLVDVLGLEVQAPTINWYHASDRSSATVDADPYAFLVNTPINPQKVSFMHASGNPLERGHVGFWASVTNNTRYDLDIGIIQVVDNYHAEYHRTITSNEISGVDKLDTRPEWSTLWLQDKSFRLLKDATGWFPSNQIPYDGPELTLDAHLPNKGYLKDMEFHADFDSHLSVKGGRIPYAQSMFGLPIALSTVYWHVDGRAVNNYNTANPTLATTATTLNPANWTVHELDSGEGHGTTLNDPWTALDDQVIKYIRWDGNMESAFANFALPVDHAMPAVAEPTVPVMTGLGPSFLWDREISPVLPTLAPDRARIALATAEPSDEGASSLDGLFRRRKGLPNLFRA